MFKVRVRYRRGACLRWTVAQTRSKRKAHEWAKNLRKALTQSHNKDDYKVFVVQTRKKVKRAG